METPLVADAFLELLERSGLLTPEKLANAIKRLNLREQPTPKDMARVLVRDGLITRFQAERLLEGRYRGFFIDKFKVLEILGAGGMACLYLAEETGTGAKYALKVLSDKHKSDAGMLARLKLEARAGKKLRHSSIIRTHGIHRTDDVFGEVHYLVMEYVEGINLEELVNLHGPLPWQQAADIARQAATGLQHAHAHGLVHRDVKPGNLLVDKHGSAKILDFGLALIDTAEDDEFSLAMIFGHSCLGTADYISPEQSLDSIAVDARADIYSLGCTLYVALAGKLPFPIASSSAKLEGHRNQQAPPLRSIMPEVPAELANVVERMMAKRTEGRYQSMAEVAEALAPFARRLPVEFDFPRMLTWRAKEARRRFAADRRPGVSSIASSSWALRSLGSASTKRLPTISAETAVSTPVRRSESAVSLKAPFVSQEKSSSLSRSELETPRETAGPALVSLDGGERYPLAGEKLIIGRDLDCDLRLASGNVSSRHCELRFDGLGWRAIDLESKNGVQVNGASIADQILRNGDKLTIARQHHFRVEFPAVSKAAPGRIVYWAVMGAVAVAASLSVLYFWRILGG